MIIKSENFGTTSSGQEVKLYTLVNKNNLTVKITNYGGIITSITTPDRNQKLGDVVLGFDSLKEYEINTPYFGAIIGRYANRIRDGIFQLAGKKYQLPRNNGRHTLHGGRKGFDKVVWEADENGSTELILTYVSQDGEEGYPGNVEVSVSYSLTDNNELKIDYKASSDQKTVINLTNHSYFNLSAGLSPTILDHELYINANRYTEVNEELIPTGQIKNVAASKFSFLIPENIGNAIKNTESGYDHNFVINGPENAMKVAATLLDPLTGRFMEVFTTQPGVQFYSGNFLDGSIVGKNGQRYPKYGGLCLETQHFPDSPNNPDFPSTVLKPGELYHQTTIYKFSIQ